MVRFIEHHLNQSAEEEAKPEMTDGESADESDSDLASDSGLDALLRYANTPLRVIWLMRRNSDEYLNSLRLTSSPPLDVTKSPSLPEPPPKPLASARPEVNNGVKRAHTRNQYVQQYLYPSPSSPLVPREIVPLIIRRKVAPLRLEPTEVEGGGTITELKILLLRDAGVYGPIVHRLIHGTFPNLEGRRRRVEEECMWLGIEGMSKEIHGKSKARQSMVLRGGEGYI